MPFHGLRRVVVRLQALRHLRSHLTHRCQFRMNEVIDMIKAGRLSKEQIGHITL